MTTYFWVDNNNNWRDEDPLQLEVIKEWDIRLNKLKEKINMVNKEQKQKDGFGLPSTDVRKKDNALVEAARIADKMAKWKAEFIDVPVVGKGTLNYEEPEEVIEESKGPTKEELKALEVKEAKIKLAAQVKAQKIAELEADLAEAKEA